MKKLEMKKLENLYGGMGTIDAVCAGVTGGRLIILGAGLAGVTIASGGTAVAVIAIGCGVYMLGNKFSWW